MKKLFKVLTCFALSLSMLASILLTAAPASASSDSTTVSEETIQLEDGAYCIVTTTETMIPSVARGKTKTKGAQKDDHKSNESRATADLFGHHSQELSDCGGGFAFDPGELPGAHGIYAAGKAARRL